MFSSLINAFGALQAFFYSVIPNYGISIILITVAIRLVLYPLTAKQARSMAQMQRVQPEIKRIQEKYKHDRQKLNEELMAFYKEHKINPMAGCLPLLLQFPIFIALFQVLRNPAKHIPVGSDLFQAFCTGMKSAAACTSDAAKELGLPKGLSFLSMDLSRGANAEHGGFIDAIPYFVLIGLVIASGYFQSRQMTSLQKGRATAQSQMMTRIFPVFFGVISYTLPAGVVLYFFVSNLWQIGQQAVVFGKDGDALRKVKPKTTAAGDGATRSGTKAAPVVTDTQARELPPDGNGDATERRPETAAASSNAPKPRQNRAKAQKKKKRKRRR